MKTDPTAAQPCRLVSTLLAEDPEMRDLVEQFVDGLSERIRELQAAFAASDWNTLERTAHRLKGAGGSYGYPAITELAARMEAEFKARRGERFADWIAALEQLIAAARAGLNAATN